MYQDVHSADTLDILTTESEGSGFPCSPLQIPFLKELEFLSHWPHSLVSYDIAWVTPDNNYQEDKPE